MNILEGPERLPDIRPAALQIRDFLTGEFEPIPAADFLDYFRAAEKLGTMKLTVKPDEPPPAPPAPPAKKGGRAGKKG